MMRSLFFKKSGCLWAVVLMTLFTGSSAWAQTTGDSKTGKGKGTTQPVNPSQGTDLSPPPKPGVPNQGTDQNPNPNSTQTVTQTATQTDTQTGSGASQVGGVDTHPDPGGKSGRKGVRGRRATKRKAAPTTQVSPPLIDSDGATPDLKERSPAVVGSIGRGQSCEDQALGQVHALMMKDSENVLGTLLETTTMKVALRALQQNPDSSSLEEYIKTQVDGLGKKLQGLKSSPEIQKSLVAIYQKYGKGADLSKIQSELEASFSRFKDACYFSKETRLTNQDSSAFILANLLGEPGSSFSEVDAAVVWLMERTRQEAEKSNSKFKIGSEQGNQLNLSTRVARYLGGIAGGRRASVEELVKEVSANEEKLKKIIQKGHEQVKESLKMCLAEEAKKNNCADCAANRLKLYESGALGLAEVQKRLMEVLTKGETLKLSDELKSKMGEVTFDFANIAKGAVERGAPRGIQDPCAGKKFTEQPPAQSQKDAASQTASEGVKTPSLSQGPFLKIPALTPIAESTFVKRPILPLFGEDKRVQAPKNSLFFKPIYSKTQEKVNVTLTNLAINMVADLNSIHRLALSYSYPAPGSSNCKLFITPDLSGYSVKLITADGRVLSSVFSESLLVPAGDSQLSVNPIAVKQITGQLGVESFDPLCHSPK